MSGEETIRAPLYRSSEDVNLPSREWIVINGQGGYASGTLSGIPTGRYHSRSPQSSGPEADVTQR